MSTTIPPPTTPAHLIRTHDGPVSALSFSSDNERLYSGDSTGNIVITSTRTLRPLAHWKAHTNSILGVEEWEKCILTHGRDNKLHVWSVVHEPDAKLGDSAAMPGLVTPNLCFSMDVNALNFCRFSLMPLHRDGQTEEALIAFPNLVESSLADVWELPSQQRLHAAIGKVGQSAATNGRGGNSTGIIMSMQLIDYVHPYVSGSSRLRLLCAYENGSVQMYEYANSFRQPSIEGRSWERLWIAKLHVESVMAMSVSVDRRIALTVSADHLVGRYDLGSSGAELNADEAFTKHRTRHPGNGAIAIRDDGRVCAIGGWDGRVRLYSTKTLKPLGTLDYHKQSCQALAFARYSTGPRNVLSQDRTEDVGSEDEMLEEEKIMRGRWLAAGSKDQRVSIWPLISFEKK